MEDDKAVQHLSRSLSPRCLKYATPFVAAQIMSGDDP